MDQQKIDRLFREKLDQVEVTPSEQAWAQVEKQIGTKKTLSFYWVAASVALFLVSWIVWPEAKAPEGFTPIAGTISSPARTEMPAFQLPEEKEQPKINVASVRKVRHSQQNQLAVAEPKVQTKTVVDEVVENPSEVITLASLTTEKTEQDESTTASIELPAKAVEEKPTRAIKITYIASADTKTEVVQKSDSSGVLKKFIAFAGKIDPGDMLADIKTAKDNLLNGGLKKKERSSM